MEIRGCGNETAVITRNHSLIKCLGSDDTGTRSYPCPSEPRCSAIVLCTVEICSQSSAAPVSELAIPSNLFSEKLARRWEVVQQRPN